MLNRKMHYYDKIDYYLNNVLCLNQLTIFEKKKITTIL